jgi:hypothetical protein
LAGFFFFFFTRGILEASRARRVGSYAKHNHNSADYEYAAQELALEGDGLVIAAAIIDGASSVVRDARPLISPAPAAPQVARGS